MKTKKPKTKKPKYGKMKKEDIMAIILTIYTPGCPAPPDPTCSDCPTKELGGLRGAWVQDSTYTFDYGDPNAWFNAICAKKVWLFPYTNGSVTPTENMSDGYGNTPQDIDSYTYNAEMHEPQFALNVPYWNAAKKSNGYLFGVKTQTKIMVSAVPVKFIPLNEVMKDVKSKIDTKVKITWVQSDLMVPLNAPPGVFDACHDC